MGQTGLPSSLCGVTVISPCLLPLASPCCNLTLIGSLPNFIFPDAWSLLSVLPLQVFPYHGQQALPVWHQVCIICTTGVLFCSSDIGSAVWQDFSWRDEHLLNPDNEPTTDQSTDTAKVELGEPMVFTGVSSKNMGERLLTGVKTAILLKPTSAWVTDHKSWEAWNILYSL